MSFEFGSKNYLLLLMWLLLTFCNNYLNEHMLQIILGVSLDAEALRLEI